MKKLVLMTAVLFMAFAGCDDNKHVMSTEAQATLEDVNSRLEALISLTNSLNTLIESDYATCSGSITDDLVRKICEIAQAATAEMQVQLLAQLGVFLNALQSQINQIKLDIISEGNDITNAQNDINAIYLILYGPAGNNGLLQSVTDAWTAINTLQNYLSTIQTGVTITGDMKPVFIGKENLAAGPVYEALLQMTDKTRVNGYVEDYATPVAVDNNGFATTNGSATITITATAHGLTNGSMVRLDGVSFTVGTANFTPSDFNSEHFTITVTDANHFTITGPRNANATTAAFGGNGITATNLNGRGMSTIWNTGDPSDSAVRTTSIGSAPYNFIVRQLLSDPAKCEICYDWTDASATFATIDAAPEGGGYNIVCN